MSDSKMFHKLAIILLPVFSALLMLNFALGVNAARTTFTNNLPDGYHWGDWLSGGDHGLAERTGLMWQAQM